MRGTGLTYPEPWSTLARQMGGPELLAQELGCSQRTLYRWAHEVTDPTRTARQTIDRLFRERGIPGPSWS